MINDPGQDDNGNTYANIKEMWDIEANSISITKWYQKADEYWKSIEPSLNGVLGGMEFLHRIDVQESNRLLSTLFKEKGNSCLDCGAGIGRISKDVLSNWFKNIDIVDQCPQYIEKAKELVPNARQYHCTGLQDFIFTNKYDCIWVQWVASHLTDQHLIKFLKDAKEALTENGVIIIKENIVSKGFIVDKQDYSVIRSDALFRQLFAAANLNIKISLLQPNFPREIYKVNQYVLTH